MCVQCVNQNVSDFSISLELQINHNFHSLSLQSVYLLTLSSYALAIQDDDNASDNDNSYVDVHQHPRSAFSCEGRKVGEYYSDLTTNCQLYFVSVCFFSSSIEDHHYNDALIM